MRAFCLAFVLVFLLIFPVRNITAAEDSPGGFKPPKPPPTEEKKHYKDYYKTWTVTEVTDTEIILERTESSGEVETVAIERSRRPALQVGDKVRYDKIRNRLRKTLRE